MQTTALMRTTAVSQMFTLQRGVLILRHSSHVSRTYLPDLADWYSESDVDLLRDSASFEARPMPHVSEDCKPESCSS